MPTSGLEDLDIYMACRRICEDIGRIHTPPPVALLSMSRRTWARLLGATASPGQLSGRVGPDTVKLFHKAGQCYAQSTSILPDQWVSVMRHDGSVELINLLDLLEVI